MTLTVLGLQRQDEVLDGGDRLLRVLQLHDVLRQALRLRRHPLQDALPVNSQRQFVSVHALERTRTHTHTYAHIHTYMQFYL